MSPLPLVAGCHKMQVVGGWPAGAMLSHPPTQRIVTASWPPGYYRVKVHFMTGSKPS